MITDFFPVMNNIDWKEALGKAFNMPVNESVPQTDDNTADKGDACQQQGKTGSGDGTLRSWQSRGHIVFDEVSGRYCKTEEYKQKYGGKV